MPAPNNIDAFLDLVRKSGLVEEKRLTTQLDSLRASGPFPADPVRLAAPLVNSGALTDLHAEQLLLGKWRGFIIGKYKILQRLRRGGEWTLYLAEHMTMRRRVNIKVLSTIKGKDPVALEQFNREARAVAALDHPNIVRAYDIDQDENLHFLVMEHVDGSSLQEIVKQTGKMDVLRAAHYIRQAALGLQHAHETAGLVHRNIKPGNILVDRNGIVKVHNLGLVRFFHDDADEHIKKYDERVLGTAEYVAPEQVLDSQSVDIRADIYSLGCTFYFCLTGRTPFAEGSVAQKLIWHQTRQPKPIRSFRPEMPDGVVSILDRMMAKDTSQRYQTPQDVAEALAPWTRTPIPPPDSELPQVSPAVFQAFSGSPSLAGPQPLVWAVPSRGGLHAFSAQTVWMTYPAPIAVPFRRFYRQSNLQGRLKMLFSAAEATIRYLLTLGLSDLLHCLAQSGEGMDIPAHQAFDFLRRPKSMQMGMWLEALRETGRALAGQPGRFFTDFSAVCSPGGEVIEQWLARLVRIRNHCMHERGTVSLNDAECQMAIREARPLLENALHAVRFVCDYPLGFVQSSPAAPSTEEHRRYYLHSCLGMQLANTIEAYVIESPIVLRDNVPFIVNVDDSRLLYLWPLLWQRVNEHTGRHTLYVFEDLPDRCRPFLSQIRLAAIDSRDEWVPVLHDPPSASHAWLFEELPLALDLPVALALGGLLRRLQQGRLEGRQLGRYRLLQMVAAGGFGTIYAATSDTNELVAVKVLESLDARHAFTRFRHEVEKLRQAGEHSGIIHCHEYGSTVINGREYPWYSMEFAHGGDLTDRIDDRNSRVAGSPWEDPDLRSEVTTEFRAIAAAVAHLHSLDIIHRDIKPGNVLISATGELHLSDFGLVKTLTPSDKTLLYGPRTSSGAILGTRHYMAPEQERGEDVGKTADVYALGLLLGELAAGKRLSVKTGTGSGSTVEQCPHFRRFPAPLRGLIRRCTDVDPQKRFPDAAAVMIAFSESCS